MNDKQLKEHNKKVWLARKAAVEDTSALHEFIKEMNKIKASK